MKRKMYLSHSAEAVVAAGDEEDPPLEVDQIPDAEHSETVANEGLAFVQLMNKLKYLKRENPKITTRDF